MHASSYHEVLVENQILSIKLCYCPTLLWVSYWKSFKALCLKIRYETNDSGLELCIATLSLYCSHLQFIIVRSCTDITLCPKVFKTFCFFPLISRQRCWHLYMVYRVSLQSLQTGTEGLYIEYAVLFSRSGGNGQRMSSDTAFVDGTYRS